MRIAVTGSSGLIGTALIGRLRADGHQVIRLVRAAAGRPGRRSRWDPRAAGAARPARWTASTPWCTWPAPASPTTAGPPATRRRSGPAGSGHPGAGRRAGGGGRRRPRVLLSGSAIGWYGDTGGREVDETAPPGTASCPDVVQRLGGGRRAGRAGRHPRGHAALRPRAVPPAAGCWPGCCCRSGSGSARRLGIGQPGT